ncbi:S41 family peptidase [Pedobacter sp. BG31]|uniref:S41 family peptidase n=1 Tax=Pedobacter sp. BG31 TaxID=3349697 RepID=UPI0035F45392
MRYLFILLAFCLATSCALKRKQYPNPAPSSDALPQLTEQQMRAEYDTLVSYIKQVSPVICFNKEVRGIDFSRHAARLRKQIGPKTTMEAYLHIIKKTLNAAQDGHTSQLNTVLLDIAKKYWIPGGLVSFDSASTQNMYKYVKYLKESFYSKADLNLIYTSGSYYNLMPFSYRGKAYPAGMKLIRCNGKNIHKFVANLTQLYAPLRWDRVNNRVYDENFYWPAEIYKQDTLRMTFVDQQYRQHQLNIHKNDSVTYLAKKLNHYGYFSQTDTVVTHYFEQEGIFYAKLPAMRTELGDTIKRRMEAIFARHPVNSVVIDIRGNGGGSDQTYNIFLKKLLSDTLKKDVVVGRNFSPETRKKYHLNRDSVINSNNKTFNPGVPQFKSQEMYFIKQSFNFVTPDRARFPFNGKIYILQDKFIYSSASNLSSLAQNAKQLISIGETPDLLGGLQADVLIKMLPYSKFIFRVEPQVDFTGIKKLEDVFQNHVEYPVSYPIENLYLRTISKDIFGKNFLLKNDPMFRKVLELEQSALAN